MTEIKASLEGNPRIFTPEKISALHDAVIADISVRRPALLQEHREEIERITKNGLATIAGFEKDALLTHPQIHLDTDIIYIDSGPGPYSFDHLGPGKTDLDDKSYHDKPWSRKMDRARIRAAYVIAGDITTRRMEEETGFRKPTKDLTEADFEKYGPTLMYTSTDWQNAHIKHTIAEMRSIKVKNHEGEETDRNVFRYPDSKIIMYDRFLSRDGLEKPIHHTEDQMEGLSFPKKLDGRNPRRIVIVSQAPHIVRVLHSLGKYSDSIPFDSVLQIIATQTPIGAINQYSVDEIAGTVKSIFIDNRASVIPFTNFEV